jgi:hypothetical protein
METVVDDLENYPGSIGKPVWPALMAVGLLWWWPVGTAVLLIAKNVMTESNNIAVGYSASINTSGTLRSHGCL